MMTIRPFLRSRDIGSSLLLDQDRRPPAGCGRPADALPLVLASARRYRPTRVAPRRPRGVLLSSSRSLRWGGGVVFVFSANRHPRGCGGGGVKGGPPRPLERRGHHYIDFFPPSPPPPPATIINLL